MAKRLSSAVKAARRAAEDDGLNTLAETLTKRIMSGVAAVIGREVQALNLSEEAVREVLKAVAVTDQAVREMLEALQQVQLPDPDISPVIEAIRELQLPPVPTKWKFEHVRDSRGRWQETIAEAISYDPVQVSGKDDIYG